MKNYEKRTPYRAATHLMVSFNSLLDKPFGSRDDVSPIPSLCRLGSPSQ
jgi:hypothetical protein